MNHIRLSQLLYIMLLLALAACAPATSVAPTPTLTPPVAKVIAEWKINIPTDIVFGFGSVWVPGHRDPNATIRIDPVSNKLIHSLTEKLLLYRLAYLLYHLHNSCDCGIRLFNFNIMTTFFCKQLLAVG
jgi:hypothetical protein